MHGGHADPTCLGAGVSQAGGPCPCDADCATGLFCVPESSQGNPQGECVLTCANDAACPDEGDWYCYKAEPADTIGICVERCQTSDDCGDDRHWCAFEECYPVCFRDDQCLSGHCNPGTHHCDDGKPQGDAPLLSDCLRDQDCASGKCVGSKAPVCRILCVPDRPVCPEGTACLGGSCEPLCQTNADCPAQWLCSASPTDPSGPRYCAFREAKQTCTGVTAAAGEPCGCDADCSGGLPCRAANALINTTAFGMCIERCDFFREGTGLKCAAGEVCIPDLDPDDVNNGACVQTCDGPSDCKAGRVCSSERGCVPFCQSDADCVGTGDLCNRYVGECMKLGGGLPIGAPCTDADQCESFWCIPGGGRPSVCGARCSIAGQACPDGATCVDYGQGDMGMCVLP